MRNFSNAIKSTSTNARILHSQPEESDTIRGAIARVAEILTPFKRIGVAFSGGVDSSVLLAIAAKTLGPTNIRAFIGLSASLASRELIIAQSIAETLNVELVRIQTNELLNPNYIKNDLSRCYFCKDELFTVIENIDLDSLGIEAIAYGENADDFIRNDRPGQIAARRHGVMRPLADAHVTKAMVRKIAEDFRLSVANKPATPCLASRISPFNDVTPTKLRQIERMEDLILGLGFTDVRVRHHETTARVEVPISEIKFLKEGTLFQQILAEAMTVGFLDVTIDPTGLQSGRFAQQLKTTIS
jgi:uncharacterized protein